MSRQIEITAEFVKERTFFENGDDSRVIIGEAIRETDTAFEHLTDPPTIVIKGEAAHNALKRGLVYRFYGHWFEHPRYGRQFVFSSFVLEEPATKNAIVTYLQQCRGIGPGTAQRLWEVFGPDAIRVIREETDRALAAVKSLKPEIAKEAAAKLQSMVRTERAKADLMGLLDGRGFPKKTLDHALHEFGAAAAGIIRRNPYILMRYRGCGFLKTDKMYLDLRLPPDRLKRQALCAWHAIARDSEGHTWFPASVATAAIGRSISGANVNPERAAELACRARYLTRRLDEHGCTWIAEHAKSNAEERIVNAIEAAILEGDDA